MAFGIGALVVALIPLMGVLSFVLGPMAIVSGVRGIRSAGPTGGGAAAAIGGIVLGVLALLLAAIAVWISVEG